MSARVRFVANPSSGRGVGRAVCEAVAEQARRHGGAWHASTDLDDFTARVRAAVDAGTERLVVVGGDGTLHHAAAILAGSETCLGIVPAGTGNDIARSLDVPRDATAALRLALRGEPRPIDLGRVGGRTFVSVAGAGFHSEVARRSAGVRWLRGSPVYVWAVLGALARYTPPTIRVHWPGGAYDGPAWMVTAANTDYFGGGMRIAPRAVVDDGRLELLIVRRVSALRLLAVFPRVYSGSHLDHPAVIAASVARATVEAGGGPWYGDGERMGGDGGGVVEIEAWPGALRVALGGAD